MFKFPFIFCCVAIMGLVSATAQADSMLINNASFSTLPSGGLGNPGSYSIGAIPGWVEAGSAPIGQWQPSGEGVFNYLPDGSTIAYSDGGTLSQNIGSVQAGHTYTLDVTIGVRLDETGDTDASAALVVNGVSYYATGVAPLAGNWSVYTVTYSALASDVGHAIALQLIGSGANGEQADFANVQLVDDPVPEPSTLVLFGGLLGFSSMLRLVQTVGAKLKTRFSPAA